jgi:hypothetical protein
MHRRFLLDRRVDGTGVSGTGPVAEGTEFSDGAVALRWRGATPCTAVWDSLAAAIAVHGHEGATVVRWLDPEPVPRPDVLHRAAASLTLPAP